jgi:Family of unknown function (DUF5996)
MARASVGRVERHLRYTAQVDSNHWKDQASTHSPDKPLVEFYSVYYTAWTHNILHVLLWSTLTDRLRFHFSHLLLIVTADNPTKAITLRPCSVAEFYQETMAALRSLGIPITIWTTPCEIPDRTPFEQDKKHTSYDPEYVQRFWRILAQASRVLSEFRSRFIGKVSPVHFFWGAFDLAVTRFSGRTAPLHPGAPNLARFVAIEAYSHEVSSCGFWPGGGLVNEPAFYAYAYPEPQGFRDYPVRPQEAFYHTDMGEFLLPYDIVRTANSPDEVLLAFLQTTYDAAATCGKWDRPALERQ